MSNLESWQQKLIAKRKTTPFEEFVKELWSWNPIMFYRNNNVISKYPVSGRVKVVSLKEYNEQRDWFCTYGKDFILGKDFFTQFQELYSVVPTSNVLHIWNNENCEYCETAVHTKDAYLSSIITQWTEKAFYSDVVREWCRNVFNSCYVQYSSENIYCCLGIETSYNIFYSRFIKNSNNIWFSANLIWCSECIFCNWLENKKFCIDNKQLDEQEYFKQKKEILAKKSEFLSWYKKLINIKWINYNSTNVVGNFIVESENVENAFVVMKMKDARNVVLTWCIETTNEIYDAFLWWNIKNYIVWVDNCGWWSEHIYLSSHIWFSSNIYYSIGMDSCSFCFWCVGLKNKHYCILNKQYSKEEWYIKVDEIFQNMEGNLTLWAFFPPRINPFYFNDTFWALLSNSTLKDDIIKEWYLWRDESIKTDISNLVDTIKTGELEKFQSFDKDWKWVISNEIIAKNIIDKDLNIYKIIPEELSFLQKYSLPIPDIHWVDRRKLHFSF